MAREGVPMPVDLSDEASVVLSPALPFVSHRAAHVHAEHQQDLRAVLGSCAQLRALLMGGAGMFLEAYFVFSIGNLTPVFRSAYPNCFGFNQEDPSRQDCNDLLLRSFPIMQILGMILGASCFALIGGKIGRRKGSILTAAIMVCLLVFMFLHFYQAFQ